MDKTNNMVFHLLLISVTFCVFISGASSSATVKLLGGNGAYGAVQVTYNGTTGMVCDDYFTDGRYHPPGEVIGVYNPLLGPRVVCLMLGFPGVESVSDNGMGGKYNPDSNVNFLLDNVKCTGKESNIADCPHLDTSGQTSNCNPDEQAGIICVYPSTLQPVQVSLEHGDDHSGAVYLTSGAFEGYLCADAWDIHSAHVVCNMLGFEGALGTKRGNLFVQPNASQILIGGVSCKGNESDLLECDPRAFEFLTDKRVGFPQYSCGNSQVAGVECNIIKNVQLVGGNAHAGAVQITYHNGTNGSVCDDDWDLNDAQVVCKMMGFPGAVGIPDGNTFYNQSSATFTMNKLDCTGDEASIQECRYISGQSCSANEMAGVNCCSLSATPVSNQTQTVSVRSELVLNATHDEIIQGQATNLTMTCDASGMMSNISFVTYMQISKVMDDGTVSSIVEFITGTKQPHFVNSSYSESGQTSGSLDPGSKPFLTLHIDTPITTDSGRYRCTLTYLDLNHAVVVKTADEQLKVWDLATLVYQRKVLDENVQDCKALCDIVPSASTTQTTATVSMTTTPTPQVKYLDISIMPTAEIIGQTRNLTILCDARRRSGDLLVVVLLQLHRVNGDGSITPLVELFPGGQSPVFVDNDIGTRSYAAGTVDVRQGVFLELVIPNPLPTDAGRYQCKMGYLGPDHVLENAVAEAKLGAFDLDAILVQVHQLEVALHGCQAACYCGA